MMGFRNYHSGKLSLCLTLWMVACSKETGSHSDSMPDMVMAGPSASTAHASVLGSLRRTDPDKSWSDHTGLPKRPYLTLDEDQPLTPNESTLLEVPLWPTLWSIEPGHSLAVRISTQPDSDACADPLGVPVGCYPSTPMLQSLRGGTYALQRGGEAASLISLPWVKRGAYATSASAVSKTADVMASSPDARPLPIDW